MVDDKKPKETKEWTSETTGLAAATIYAGVGKLVGDSGLVNVPGGKTVVLKTLMGCAAYFAVLEQISRHDMIDMAKTTFDSITELNAEQKAKDPNVS